MLKNSIEMDVKTRCMEQSAARAGTAENTGTSPSCVNKTVRSGEQIISKTFPAILEEPGFDVELQ